MSGFKGTPGNDWPSIAHNKLIENDPSIIKVPMDDVDWGATKNTMGKVRRPASGGNGKLGIKHVPDNGKT